MTHQYCLCKATRHYTGGTPRPDLVYSSLDDAINSAKSQKNPVGYDVYEIDNTKALWKYWEWKNGT